MSSQPDGRGLDPEPDILQVVLLRVRAAAPLLTDEQARQIEDAVRAELGGLRVRIPKRKKHPNQEQRKAIFKEAMGSASDAEITERHGIHRATLYRMLKRGGGEG
jgi:DNA invertase Pin-like site-specific DNA recombinase